VVLEISLIVVLILLNSLFAMSETALDPARWETRNLLTVLMEENTASPDAEKGWGSFRRRLPRPAIR
jgi:hypothetical protein